MQKELEEAPVRRTIHSFRVTLEDFLHKAIASFDHGWPDLDYLGEELRHTENTLRPKEMILGNMIGHEIKRNSELGNYLYDQIKDLPALIQKATTLQNAYYQAQNAQGHHPPRYTFYDGYGERLTEKFIELVKPDAIQLLELNNVEDEVQESESKRMVQRFWHIPTAMGSRRRAAPSLSLATSSAQHRIAK